MIAVRLHDGRGWYDANVLDISARGLLLQASAPPARGAYIEVRRGTHVIVGRVVWTKADRFGVRAQDRAEIDALIANSSTARHVTKGSPGIPFERRTQPRPDHLQWRHARNQETGRALQFAFIVGFSFALAACAYTAVADTLSRPLTEIGLELGAITRR